MTHTVEVHAENTSACSRTEYFHRTRRAFVGIASFPKASVSGQPPTRRITVSSLDPSPPSAQHLGAGHSPAKPLS